MQFKDIAGHNNIKQKLINTVKDNRVSHALLFLGPQGCGKLALAIAYAQYISCQNKQENDSCGTCISCQKYKKLIHPDLHFVYPVVRTPKFKKPVSDDFIKEWRSYLLQGNYHILDNWFDYLGTDNLQGSIFAQESQEIIRKLNLKTFEGEYKILIIWMAEKMNTVASNKLLKMIEEPPSKTLFVLVSESEEDILTTIRSRTQLIKLNRITDSEMIKSLQKEYPQADESMISDAVRISSGNYLNASSIIKNNLEGGGTEKSINFHTFSTLMRLCYSVKIPEIINWVEEISKIGREKQKLFLNYALRMMRENFIYNISPNTREEVNYLTNEERAFSEKFSAFIHKNNIFKIAEEFSLAQRHIERNAYNKLVFLDLALKITRLLKVKNK